MKDLARRSALTYKAQDGKVLVVEDFTFDNPSTKEFINLCKNLNVNDKKALFLLGDENKVVYLSARNLQGKEVLPFMMLNTYSVVDADVLVLTEGALGRTEELFGK